MLEMVVKMALCRYPKAYSDLRQRQSFVCV